MIIVAGAGRCGTSLMMQTLDLLGVPLLGNPGGRECHQLWQAYENKNNLKLNNVPTNKNPKGYYELSLNEVMSVINQDDAHKNQAIKITAIDVVNIDPERIELIIFCKRRNIRKAAKSMYHLAIQDYEFARDNNLSNCFAFLYPNFKIKDWENWMKQYNLQVESWCNKIRVPLVEVWFEDFLDNPLASIDRLKEHLNFNNQNISAALKNVDKK